MNLTIPFFLLTIDSVFIYLIILLAILGIFIGFRFVYKIKICVDNLQKFIASVKQIGKFDEILNFPNNKLGKNSKEIIELCQNLIKTKEELSIEKQKFNYHLQVATDGIAIFSEDFKCIMFNLRFIEFANSVLEHIIFEPAAFLESSQRNKILEGLNNSNDFTWMIERNNKIIQVKLLKFEDKSFELLLNDITQTAKEGRFKKQLIDNLSHELKTPLCSIQGYLESVISRPHAPPEQLNNFINRAFEQSQRMSNLLNSVAKINKIEQAKEFFEIEKINVKKIITKVIDDNIQVLQEKNVKVEIDISAQLMINANEELFFSIFSNLVINSLAYAGENFTIGISCEIITENYINFIYFDTGKGIAEKHFNRVFERFYRIDKGRSQKIGGTGLGLAIVKNAVLFHNGNIVARTHQGGGLEFVFGWLLK